MQNSCVFKATEIIKAILYRIQKALCQVKFFLPNTFCTKFIKNLFYSGLSFRLVDSPGWPGTSGYQAPAIPASAYTGTGFRKCPGSPKSFNCAPKTPHDRGLCLAPNPQAGFSPNSSFTFSRLTSLWPEDIGTLLTWSPAELWSIAQCPFLVPPLPSDLKHPPWSQYPSSRFSIRHLPSVNLNYCCVLRSSSVFHTNHQECTLIS